MFFKLDARGGYWQILVDLESSKPLRFDTPLGRQLFKRMLYGLYTVLEVFQVTT